MRGKALILALACFLNQIAGADVSQIEMSAPVAVYDVSDPKFSWGRSSSPPAVLDANKLRLVHGAGSDEDFAAYLLDGSEEERALANAVSNGRLELTYVGKSNKLVAAVTYKLSRSLNTKELEQLRQYTYGQLLDGIGGNFQQEYAARQEKLWIAFEDIEYDEFHIASSKR